MTSSEGCLGRERRCLVHPTAQSLLHSTGEGDWELRAAGCRAQSQSWWGSGWHLPLVLQKTGEGGSKGYPQCPCWGKEQFPQRGPLEVQPPFLTVVQVLLWRWISKWGMGPTDTQDWFSCKIWIRTKMDGRKQDLLSMNILTLETLKVLPLWLWFSHINEMSSLTVPNILLLSVVWDKRIWFHPLQIHNRPMLEKCTDAIVVEMHKCM